MVRHYVVTLDGTTQRLSTAAIGAAQNQDDLLIKALVLQPNGANANPTFVGGFEPNNLSTTVFGFRLEAGAAGTPPTPFRLDFSNAPMRLSDFAGRGTNTEKLHVTVVR